MSQNQECISCTITVPNKQVDFFHYSGSQNFLSQDLFTLLNTTKDSKELLFTCIIFINIYTFKNQAEQIKHMY